MTEIRKILVNGSHPLFKKEGMLYKEFPSDYKQIRYFTVLIVQKASPEIRDVNLLEQQISELIKNAIKHGNKLDPRKFVRVWFYFSLEEARLIVQDEGEGFQKIEEWNAFNAQRIRCFNERDFERMAQYVSYRTQSSDDTDGGNALFAALEYWNGGVVFDEKRTSVAVKRIFSSKKFSS